MIDRYVSPSELRRLLSALLVVLGFISLAALFGFIIVPGLRFQAHPVPETSVTAVQGDAGWLDPAEYPRAARQVIPPVDPRTVMTPNPELMARGRALYAQTCATCHGPEGKGNGPGAKGLNPVPRDFTANVGWKNGTHLDNIFRTLDEGVKGSSMVSYTYLSKRDRMALVHVVQSLGSFDHGASDPAAIAALEKRFATAGEVIAARIPVGQAIEHLLAESQAPGLVNATASPLLREAILDPVRAGQTLAGIPGWQGSDQSLARGVLPGLRTNGFSPVVATYTPARWNELRTSLAVH